MGLLGRRYSNNEIVDELVLSVRTVDRHVANIYAKTGVSTRRQAASRALATGLLQTDWARARWVVVTHAILEAQA